MMPAISALTFAAGAVALVGPALASPAQRPLTFCLAAHNLPFSTSHPPWGIDGELVKAIGAELDREVGFVWISEEEETPEAALLEGRCDAATGAVVDVGTMAQPNAVPGLALTAPYYTAGYMLVHKSDLDAPQSLDELSGVRIGVEMVSIPIYTLKQRGHRVYALDDTEAVVRAVADGRAGYGYVWGPVGAWLLRERDDLVLARSFEPEDRWSFAMAVRSEHGGLRSELNKALAEITRRGDIKRIFEKYEIPYFSPIHSD